MLEMEVLQGEITGF